ncbi:hypothetical protein ACLBXM_08380 [Xanthobacteraceae bacterium A53D]
MQEIFAALISFFIIQPLESELKESLASAGIAQEQVGQALGCLQAEGPAVVNRAMDNPGWAVSTTVGLWIGTSNPREVLAEAAPRCVTATV